MKALICQAVWKFLSTDSTERALASGHLTPVYLEIVFFILSCYRSETYSEEEKSKEKK